MSSNGFSFNENKIPSPCGWGRHLIPVNKFMINLSKKIIFVVTRCVCPLAPRLCCVQEEKLIFYHSVILFISFFFRSFDFLIFINLVAGCFRIHFRKRDNWDVGFKDKVLIKIGGCPFCRFQINKTHYYFNRNIVL